MTEDGSATGEQPHWGDVELLDEGGLGGPKAAVAHDGTTTALWVGREGERAILARQAAPGQSWGPIEEVAPVEGRTLLLGLQASSGGALTAVWWRQNRLYVADRPDDGPWSTPQSVATGMIGSDIPKVAISTSGAVVAAMSRGFVSVAHRSPRGPWTGPARVPAINGAILPAVAIDDSEVVSVAYLTDGNGYNAYRRVRLVQGGPHGWEEPVDIYPRHDVYEISLDTTARGDLRMAWSARLRGTRLSTVYLARERPDGKWASSRLAPPQDKFALMVAVHASRDGSALVAWAQHRDQLCWGSSEIRSAFVAPSGVVKDRSLHATGRGILCFEPELVGTVGGTGLISWAQGHWARGYNTMATFSAADWVRWKPSVVVGELEAPAVNLDGASPWATAAAGGEAVVLWRSTEGIVARRATYRMD